MSQGITARGLQAMRTYLIIGMIICLTVLVAVLYAPLQWQYFLYRLHHTSGLKKCLLIDKLALVLSTKIQKGMSKAEVRSVLGDPQNTDSDYVWMWTTKDGSENPRETTWQSLSFATAGYFVVFYQDRLVSPIIKCTEANPWGVMVHSTDLNIEMVEQLIGKRPLIEDEHGEIRPIHY